MQKKNVIVVMMDTLQFNYLGCYGNDWIQTPHIDRFAKQGVLFENAYAEGLPTVPCRRAMFTGRYTLPTKGWSQLDLDDTNILNIAVGYRWCSWLRRHPARKRGFRAVAIPDSKLNLRAR
jgi:hypothetical protein